MNPSSLLLLLAVVVGGSLAQFGASGIAQILKVHNDLRSQIALGKYNANGTKKAAATNIMKMKWDNSIAKLAQAYANTCPTGHSQSRKNLGENLYWNLGKNITKFDHLGTSASERWAIEFQNFGWKYNKMDMALFKSGIGHATQMAWYDSSLIGCGVKNCGIDKKYSGNWFKVAVVCQYRNPGNYMTREIYKSGKTCSECPAKTKCEKSTGLCV